MAESKLPKFKSLDDLVDFFDRQDLGDYLDEMPEVEFEIALKKKTIVLTLDAETSGKLADIARAKKTTPSLLVENWLLEKIRENE